LLLEERLQRHSGDQIRGLGLVFFDLAVANAAFREDLEQEGGGWYSTCEGHCTEVCGADFQFEGRSGVYTFVMIACTLLSPCILTLNSTICGKESGKVETRALSTRMYGPFACL